MKLSINSKLTALLAVSALAMTGCQDEEFGYEADQIAYETLFKNSFGEIDPNHDWNAAERGSISVKSDETTDIKIYAKIGAQYRLVAHYEDVSGQQELGFDAVDGTSEVMVSDGRTAQVVPVGGNANFGSATRTIMSGSSFGVTISETTDYLVFTENTQLAFTNVCPEEDSDNPQRVTSNFTLVSNGVFTLYPVYFCTGSYSEIGLYYRDGNNEIKYVPFYKMKEGEDFQYKDRDGNWNNYTTSNQKADIAAGTSSDDKFYRSKGIIIDMPAGTVFGMYMKPLSMDNSALQENEYFYNYSETELNVITRIPTGTKAGLQNFPIHTDARNKVSFAGFYTVGQKTFFSFEDWAYSGCDINDMVFMFDGALPTPVDQTATEWLVACEDLNVRGTFDDEDFNDIVFKVSHGSYKGTGYGTLQFTPLAAVGTYRSDIYVPRMLNAETLGADSLIGEIHELVVPGTRPVSTNLYSVINGETVGNAGPSITIPCASEFSMDAYIPGTYSSSATDYYAKTKMGGFTIKSYRSAEESSAEDAKVIAPNDVRGTAGAMFCIPASWTDESNIRHTWCWPKEKINIATAYPKFTDWVSNMSSNTDWYKATPTPDKAVTGAYAIHETTSSGNGGSLNETTFVALEASKNSVIISTLAENPTETITFTSGSTGAYTLISGSVTYFDVTTNFTDPNAQIKQIVIRGLSAGHGTITVRQEGDNTYSAQTITIDVTITSDHSPELALGSFEDATLNYPFNIKTKTVNIVSLSDGNLSISPLASGAPVTVVVSEQPTYDDTTGKYIGAITLTSVCEGGPVNITINQEASTVNETSYSAGTISLSVEVTEFEYTQPDGYETRIEAPAKATAGWYDLNSILALSASDYSNGIKICVVLEEPASEEFTSWVGSGSNNKRVSGSSQIGSTLIEFEVSSEEFTNWHSWYISSGIDLMDVQGNVNSVWVKEVTKSPVGPIDGDSNKPTGDATITDFTQGDQMPLASNLFAEATSSITLWFKCPAGKRTYVVLMSTDNIYAGLDTPVSDATRNEETFIKKTYDSSTAVYNAAKEGKLILRDWGSNTIMNLEGLWIECQ